MEKILSISIAAYNVENVLDKTLSSLNDERYVDDIEVIIVNDGSKDSTEKIGLKYQSLNPETFKYICKKNGGHGSTINKGIEEANGKYFRIIDGDDWVDKDEFFSYITKLKKTDADMILSDFAKIYRDKKDVCKNFTAMKPNVIYDLHEKLNVNWITLHTLTIKTKLLKNTVKITEHCFYVDIEFVVWSIYLAKTVQYFDNTVYMYRMGTENQSVNKMNMIKNIHMQEKVTYNLAKLYVTFNKKELGGKKEIILSRIVKSIGATVRTYLLMDDAIIAKEKIKKYENEIKNISNELFDRTQREMFFKILRLCNYTFLPLIQKAYKGWCLH